MVHRCPNENGYDNLITQKNNLATGRGRIMDVDMASESTRLSKYNILVQASTSCWPKPTHCLKSH